MWTVNKFMCHVELFVGCVIIGMLNAVFSVIFAVYSIMDIFYHKLEDERQRVRRAAVAVESRSQLIDSYELFKGFVFITYVLHFILCIYLIRAAIKKSTKYVKRYLIVSSLATFAALSEGFCIALDSGFTNMALNYFAFSIWNVYFLICVFSYYDRYKERASYDDSYEAETMGV